jgi:enoyl-CoA hydratase
MIARETRGAIEVVRLAHGKVSALDIELSEALTSALQTLASGPATAVVLTGTGSTFSAGVDLFRVLNGGTDYLRRFLPAMETLFLTLLKFPKPLVAAINGHAIAGGCIMAATTDVRLMAEGRARIGIPELLVGVPFPVLPFEIMRARVSGADFRELVVTGKTLTPIEAFDLGLVDDVVASDGLLERAVEAAEQLAQIPAVSFRLTKQAFAAPIENNLQRSQALNAAAVSAWENAAVQERIRAYLDQTVGRK